MSQTNRQVADRSEISDSVNDGTAFKRIGDALRGLRYGSVLVIVQDGVVVQIDRTEKMRLDKSDR